MELAGVTKIAAAMSEAMNIAAAVYKGDDGAWQGIPDAQLMVLSALETFATLVESTPVDAPEGVRMGEALAHARALKTEIAGSGLPASDAARNIAADFLAAFNVDASQLTS